VYQRRAENSELAALAELQEAAGVVDFRIGQQAACNPRCSQISRGWPEFLETSQLRADVGRDV
jgi:hypothetical protein